MKAILFVAFILPASELAARPHVGATRHSLDHLAHIRTPSEHKEHSFKGKFHLFSGRTGHRTTTPTP